MKRIPVYLSIEEMKELVSCMNFKIKNNRTISWELLDLLEEEIEMNEEEDHPEPTTKEEYNERYGLGEGEK